MTPYEALGVNGMFLPTPYGVTSAEWVKNKRLVSFNLAGTDPTMGIKRRGSGVGVGILPSI